MMDVTLKNGEYMIVTTFTKEKIILVKCENGELIVNKEK